MYFELNQTQLICYKDRNNTKVAEWNFADLTIYVGVEKKRKPPTAWVCMYREEIFYSTFSWMFC